MKNFRMIDLFTVEQGLGGFDSPQKAVEAAYAISNLGRIVCDSTPVYFSSHCLSESDSRYGLFTAKSAQLKYFREFIKRPDVEENLNTGGKLVFNYIHQAENGMFFPIPVILRKEGKNFTYDFDFNREGYDLTEEDFKKIEKNIKKIILGKAKQYEGFGILRSGNSDLFPEFPESRSTAGVLVDIIASDYLEGKRERVSVEQVTAHVKSRFSAVPGAILMLLV